jgi:phosphatidylglycerol---prolipoprotein diacylglyceryl transferase
VLYVVLYDIIRLPLETMKIDPADHFLGQRVNVWVAAGTLIVALAIFVILFRRRTPEPPPEPAEAAPAVAGHVPTARPEAAIAARRASQRRRRPG